MFVASNYNCSTPHVQSGQFRSLFARNMDALPLLTVSTQQSRDIIASRAEKLLSPQLTGGVSSQEEEDGEEEEIPCTPAFGSSSLAGGVAPAPSAMLAVGVAMGSCDEPGGMAEGSCGGMLEAEDDLQEVDQVQDDYKEEARSDGGPQEVENFDEGLTVFSSEEGTGGLLPGDVGSEVSFARELEGMAYPTLWELGACDLTSEEGVRDFYVPSLAPIITPIKVGVSGVLHIHLTSSSAPSPPPISLPLSSSSIIL